LHLLSLSYTYYLLSLSLIKAATQLAVRKGIKVIATTRDESKADLIYKLGASYVIKINDDGLFDEAIRKYLGGTGVDIILGISFIHM
jgi:NADPH:quinone reductase-like Zn-dependent oxidoreductase